MRKSFGLDSNWLHQFLRWRTDYNESCDFILMPPGARVREEYSILGKKIRLEKDADGIQIIAERRVFWRRELHLSQTELDVLQFPLPGAEPVTIHYADNPALCRSILHQFPYFFETITIDAEQWQAIADELLPAKFSDRVDFNPHHFERLPAESALYVLKKMSDYMLFSNMQEILKLPQFSQKGSNQSRKELLTYFFSTVPITAYSDHRLHNLFPSLTVEEKKELFDCLMEKNKDPVCESIDRVREYFLKIHRVQSEFSQSVGFQYMHLNGCSLEEILPWLPDNISLENMRVLAVAILKAPENLAKLSKCASVIPFDSFTNDAYRKVFSDAQVDIAQRLSPTNDDDFVRQLNKKIDYYSARELYFDGLSDHWRDASFEKKKLYGEIKQIFIEERDQYKVNKDDIGSPSARTNCLTNMSNAVQRIYAYSGINEGRSIFAQALRAIKSLAIYFGLLQPEIVEPCFFISDNMHRFLKSSHTQTVKDVVEIVQAAPESPVI